MRRRRREPAGRTGVRTGLRTPSLRRRVTIAVLALLALMLLAVAVVTDVVLESRLDGQLRQRLADRASVASALVQTVSSRDLARRLEGDGVSVVLRTSSGQVYAEGPLGGAAANSTDATDGTDDTVAGEGAQVPGPPGAPKPKPAGPKTPAAAVAQQGDQLSVQRTLSDGSSVTLLADVSDVRRTLAQVRLALVLAAVVVLIGAAVAVPPVVSRTLRPLDRITDVARSITEGDRQQRLRPLQPDTELGRTAVSFDEMLDAVVGAETQARGSEQRLRDFLSDAAHELRTPIAGVQAAAEHLLRDDPARFDREQALVGLVRESRRAGRLVEDMLTMARIDRGLSLRREPFDLVELAREVSQVTATRSPALNLTMNLTGELAVTGGPQWVLADRDRITQILTNLLDNAVRAAHSCVETTVWSIGDQTGLDVRDDGAGIPPAAREHVFERLVRLDVARSGQLGGAGLGLSIARGIARAHGGDLMCLPNPPGRSGATFRLSLPSSG